jgi:hypothetical protein
VNPEITKYMLMSCYQKAGQKHSMKIENRSFEDVAKLVCLGTTLCASPGRGSSPGRVMA